MFRTLLNKLEIFPTEWDFPHALYLSAWHQLLNILERRNTSVVFDTSIYLIFMFSPLLSLSLSSRLPTEFKLPSPLSGTIAIASWVSHHTCSCHFWFFSIFYQSKLFEKQISSCEILLKIFQWLPIIPRLNTQILKCTTGPYVVRPSFPSSTCNTLCTPATDVFPRNLYSFPTSPLHMTFPSAWKTVSSLLCSLLLQMSIVMSSEKLSLTFPVKFPYYIILEYCVPLLYSSYYS